MLICPECGGEMLYQQSIRRYVCKSCGISLTREEIDEIKAKYRVHKDEDEKEKIRKEYIKWWTTKK